MTGWVVRKFGGTAPRLHPRELPDNFAQVASNTVLTGGTLKPLLGNVAVSGSPITLTGTVQTVYRFGQDLTADGTYWFQWTTDGDVCRGQIHGDTTERTYFTNTALAAPQVTDSSIATGATPYPAASFVLGVPTPVTAPTLVVSGTGTSGAIAESRAYVYTYTDQWGEEGSASPPSAITSVISGQTVTVTLPGSAPTPPVAGSYKLSTGGTINVYRSVAGTVGATYLFVGSVALGTTTFVDTLTNTAIASAGALSSLGNVPPPPTLQGLINLPNGMMAGFDSGGTGRDFYLCAPYRPYAWPVANSDTVDYRIVGLGAFGTTAVILTQGNPYFVTGSDPSNTVTVQCDCDQACVSKRSIANVAGGVVYASPEGLYRASANGFTNLTQNLFTKVEWQALHPSTINGFATEERYLGFYDTGTVKAGFMLDLTTGEFMPLDWWASAGYYEAKFNTLYLAVPNGGNSTLVRFNQGSAGTFAWQSKDFYSPQAVSMAAARVEAASYSSVTAKFYADGTLVYTATVTSADMFRLPGGVLANTWSMSVATGAEVYSMGMAQSCVELANG